MCVMLSTGNVLLHEFAHLIWGLLDEYPKPDKGESYFYMGDKSKYDPNKYEALPVRCSETVQGRQYEKGADGKYSKTVTCPDDPKTGLPNKDCIWQAHRIGQTATASIMYAQFVDNVS